MNINDYERHSNSRQKTDFKETINIPIAIPAWGMLCLLGALFYYGGSAMQKLNTVIENSAKTELQVVASAADLKTMQISVADLKARVVALEGRGSHK